MICNILDHRKKPFFWKRINAIIEPTWHDNSHDGDRTEATEGESEYDEKANISLEEALAWGNEFKYPVTLFLYDEGDGIAP
jgi:hypothetical protein